VDLINVRSVEFFDNLGRKD